ncbi:unnamed protein product [Rhizoctonia solani]|uniref:Zn(2)-C6 fungal-type domain-containing protein n=1 Tax=Rhizoctonia solani TaxID=456999 RepID=A0A8H3H824_9AGAM|nr:unnamed protein product [Rhizoctonia solani]
MAEDFEHDLYTDPGDQSRAQSLQPASQEETIRDGTAPPRPDRQPSEALVMEARCDPCKARGQRSKCDRAWPSCSKCVREGTEAGCYQATEAQTLGLPHQDGAPRAVSAVPPPLPPAPPAPDSPLRRAASAAPVLQRQAHVPNIDRTDEGPRLIRIPVRGPRRSQSPPRAPPSMRASPRARTPPMILANHDTGLGAQLLRARAAQLKEDLANLEAQAKELEAQPTQPSLTALPPVLSHVAAPIYAGQGLEGRRAPSIVPGLKGGATFALVPDAIRKLYTGPNGCHTHVSLRYFTDEFREDAGHAKDDGRR